MCVCVCMCMCVYVYVCVFVCRCSTSKDSQITSNTSGTSTAAMRCTANCATVARRQLPNARAEERGKHRKGESVQERQFYNDFVALHTPSTRLQTFKALWRNCIAPSQIYGPLLWRHGVFADFWLFFGQISGSCRIWGLFCRRVGRWLLGLLKSAKEPSNSAEKH